MSLSVCRGKEYAENRISLQRGKSQQKGPPVCCTLYVYLSDFPANQTLVFLFNSRENET